MNQTNEISTATINHFTKFKFLKCILTDKCFKPRYCLENINHINWFKLLDIEDTKSEFPQLAYPMVCFTDLPHDKWPIHKATYGPCVITLSEDWKLKNGLIPVIYLVHGDFMSNNLLPQCLCMAKRYCEEHKQNGYMNFVNLIIPYLKLYSEGEKRYYDEREWRYFPWKGLDHKYFTMTEDEYKDKSILEMRQSELLNDHANHLYFKFDDIVSVEVTNEREKDDIAQILSTSFNISAKIAKNKITISI